MQLFSIMMSSPLMQSDVDGKVELRWNRPGSPVWGMSLLSEVPLHCCAERGSSESRPSTSCNATYIKTGPSGRSLWRCSGINTVRIWHARYGSILPHLVSLPLFLLSLGRPWCFLSTSIYSSAAVCTSGRAPGPSPLSSQLALCARSTVCFMTGWLT